MDERTQSIPHWGARDIQLLGDLLFDDARAGWQGAGGYGDADGLGDVLPQQPELQRDSKRRSGGHNLSTLAAIVYATTPGLYVVDRRW